MTGRTREQLVASLRSKEYRDLFVEERINALIPAQIRAIRDAKGWTQKEFGDKAEMAQTFVSLLENPDYGGYTLRTLRRVAAAFDVGLEVRFVSFSELLDRATRTSPESLEVPDFEHDAQLVRSVHLVPDGTAGLTTAISYDQIAEPWQREPISLDDYRYRTSRTESPEQTGDITAVAYSR